MDLALKMSGAREQEQTLLRTLCDASVDHWTARLREDVALEDCCCAFLCAAAFTATADFVIARAEPNASFTAGDVRVQARSAEENAEAAADLRRGAELLMASYARPEGFAFLGVRG